MRRWGLALVLALAALTTGGAAAAPPAEVRVGAKIFTESTILAELATQLLQRSGVAARHRRDLSGGTTVLWRALQRGELDVYPEYTGTLALDLLHDGSLRSAAALRERLRPLGLGVTEPLGFNNTYALGVREERARALQLVRISDLRGHPRLRLGFSHEFLDRPEGFGGLKARYGLPQTSVTGLDHDLAYRAIENGSIDLVDLYSTDAEIAYYHLRVLDDDLHHFPEYQALYLHRLDLPPAALLGLRRLEGRIPGEEIIRLNARAKLGKEPEAVVAASFLQERLGVQGAAGAAPGRVGEVLLRTREHLTLVGISLFLAVLLGVPLGLLAARYRAFGQGLLGGLGVIQTVPSLALLVFMIPLLGIGTAPAVVALFLYSLLPIVRNTFTGLTQIPAALRESAEALGLSPAAQRVRVELPLAAASILAGIKTAAVINVGTATLGAIIGAGGYGQPILIGIRRDDLGMILEGAVPAALLAVLVQGLFELMERRLVPRGLRAATGSPLS